MTTLTNLADFSSHRGQNATDFVSTDAAALASHMSHCASSRSRFFGLHAALEFAHSMLHPRLVTAALLTCFLAGLVCIV